MFRIICLVAVLGSSCFGSTYSFVWTGSEFNLVIEGTSSADSIAIVRQNDFITLVLDGVTVLNGSSTNTPKIIINTYGGNDTVLIGVAPPRELNGMGNPTGPLINIGLYEVDLGDGDDLLVTNSNPSYPWSSGDACVGLITANGENGVDTFDIGDVPKLSGSSDSTFNGQNGNDRFDYRANKTPMTFVGGADTDDVHAWVEPSAGFNYSSSSNENGYVHY